MSFILDALKRAERERRLEKPPDLRAVYEENHLPRRGIRPWIWVSGSFIIGAIVAWLVLWPEDRGPARPIVPTASSASRKGPVKMAARKPETRPSPTSPRSRAVKPPKVPPSLTSPSQPARAPVQMSTPSQAAKTPAKITETSVAEKAAKPASKPLDKATQLPGAASPAASPGPVLKGQETAPVQPAPPVASAPQATPVEPVLPRPTAPSSPPADPKQEVVRGKQASIPLFSELPYEVREKLERLQINVHSYSENPAECLVFINMKRYKVGERIGEKGPILKEITPDGVIIDYGEGLTRLKVWE
jgi:hypothetical protein